MHINLRRAVMILVACVICAAVAGCGRKGPLEAHPADPNKPRAKTGSAPGSEKFTLGSRRKSLSTAIKAPDRPFILDVLL